MIEVATERAMPQFASTQRRHARLLRILTISAILAVVLIGLFLRIWILGREPWADDTAAPALMAQQILHGHFFAFYWGQSYGGAEPYVVAAMFALFGQSSFTLGLTPVVLDVVAAILVWRIGRRLFGSTVGVGAGLLFWVWPEVYVFESTVEWGFRFVALVSGLAVMLLAIRIAQRGEPPADLGSGSIWTVQATSSSATVRRLDWLALGLFAGVGWWASPEVVYYLVPAGIFLGWHLLGRQVEFRPGLLTLTVAGAVVGAFPWLWANAQSNHHLFSLRRIPAQPDPSYTSHLSIFFTHIVPTVLGLRLRSEFDLQTASSSGSGWLVNPSGSGWATAIGEIAFAAALAGILVWMVVLIRRRQALVLVGAALFFPFAYALSPYSWDWHDGRYGLFLAPIVSLLVASGVYSAFTRVGRPRLAMSLAIVAGLALTLTAVTQLDPYTPAPSIASRSGWFTWSSNPNPGVVDLAKSLESAHLDHVFASFYVSWALDWESPGFQITASDVRLSRYEPYYLTVANSRSPAAWLFVKPGSAQSLEPVLNLATGQFDPGCLDDASDLCVYPGSFEAYLARQGIGYRVLHLGRWIVVEPARPIPETTLRALRGLVPTGKVFDISALRGP